MFDDTGNLLKLILNSDELKQSLNIDNCLYPALLSRC